MPYIYLILKLGAQNANTSPPNNQIPFCNCFKRLCIPYTIVNQEPHAEKNRITYVDRYIKQQNIIANFKAALSNI